MSYSRILAAALLLLLVNQSTMPAFSDEPPYEKLLERAERQLKKKDYEAAVSTFTKVLKDYPTVYQAYLLRAEARKELKDTDGALKDYDQSIKTNPNVVEAYLKRGQLNASLGHRKAAIEDYTEALRLNPKESKARLLRASSLKDSGDYAGAAADYDSMIKAQPSSIEARQERAECRLRSYDYGGAIEDYNYLLKKFKSKVFPVHYELGEALDLKGDKEGAKEHYGLVIDFYSKQLARSKKKGWDYIHRGLAYYKLGEKDKALRDLEAGVAVLPGDAQARFELGHIRLSNGDTAGAIKDLDEALKLDPRLYRALVDRAEAYRQKSNYKAALSDLEIALSMSNSPDLLLGIGMTKLAVGDVRGAESSLIEANKLSSRKIEEQKKALSDAIDRPEPSATGSKLSKSRQLKELAILELVSGNADRAESLVRQSIDIEEKQGVPAETESACSLLLLGKIYMQKHSLLKAETMYRGALNKLRNHSDENAKYAVFLLEDCAKILMDAASYEEAGSILAQTRLVRATTGLTENVFSGELSRRAEQAVEAYKQKRKNDRQEDLVRKVASLHSGGDGGDGGDGGGSGSGEGEKKVVINKSIRDKWAMIVGISEFKDPKINLRYAAKDAKDFYDFLVNEKNFAADHVQLLTNEKATRANILSLLGSKWLPRLAESDDLVIIYFSSHGSPSNLDIGGVNYLVAYDTDPTDLYATGIAMQDLARIIKGRVHSDRIMLVLDACHSGVAAPSSGKGIVRTGNVDVDQVVQGTGQLVISSSTPDQRSWESDRYQGSVFTKYLIEGLRKDGRMTKLGDAYQYLETEVKREVLRDRGLLQTPVMKSKWEGKDLIIGAPASQPVPGITGLDLPDAPGPAQSGSQSDKQQSANDDGAEPARKKSAEPKPRLPRKQRHH